MAPTASDPTEHLPLTPVVLHILLALADEARHGYAIARDVEELTDGTLRMGPGTLYGSIQRMLASGLIDESRTPVARKADDDERRRYYKLTTLGRRALEAELVRLERVVTAARAKQVLRSPKPA